jgi:nicotinamide-nucleotide amidase
MILTNQEADKLKQLIIQHQFTVATAESLTCGNIQASIGAISGASSFFEGGVTAYNLDQKVSLLGINRTHAQSVDCVSANVASEMAQGACRRFNSAIGLATTGYAENSPPGAEFTGAYAYFAIWNNKLGSTSPVKSGLVRKIGYDITVNQLDPVKQVLLRSPVSKVDTGLFQSLTSDRVKMQFQVSRVVLLVFLDYLVYL